MNISTITTDVNIILTGLLLSVPTCLLVQSQKFTETNSVRSIDGIMKEIYNIISGEKGKKRNWVAFRNLFLPTARFTVLNLDDNFPESVDKLHLKSLSYKCTIPIMKKVFNNMKSLM